MNGAHIGRLNVFINVTNMHSPLWTLRGDHSKKWFNARVPLISSRPFRIIIEAVRGYDILSNIAIDDIFFTEKTCLIYPWDATPDKYVTVPIRTTTRSLKPSSRYDCDFELDFCGVWTNNGSIEWTRVQGITGSQVSGPLAADHSTASPNGWYLYADTKRAGQNDMASIYTTFIASAKCMKFYYYVTADNDFTFSAYSRGANGKQYKVWSITSSHVGSWSVAQVFVLLPEPTATRVVFELTNVTMAGPDDIFALDDIYFTEGYCVDNSDLENLCTFSNNDLCGYNVTENPITGFSWRQFTNGEARLFEKKKRQFIKSSFLLKKNILFSQINKMRRRSRSEITRAAPISTTDTYMRSI